MTNKTFYPLLILLFISVGCNTIRKIPGFGKDTPGAGPVVLPDDYTITGTTVIDNQWIETPTVGRSFTVQVKIPGATDYRSLTRLFEFGVYTRGQGAIEFRHEWQQQENGYYRMTGRWAAPAGTSFIIRSIRTGADLAG